jgi:hypothetical protein
MYFNSIRLYRLTDDTQKSGTNNEIVTTRKMNCKEDRHDLHRR